MKAFRFARSFVVVVGLLMAAGAAAPALADPRLEPYLEALAKHGRPPLEYVLGALDRHNLLLFDDARHTAVEPFEFYRQLVESAEFRNRCKSIFVEAFLINRQEEIDAYLSSAPENLELLYRALRDDYSGTGWSLATYLDLMRTIYRINQVLAPEKRLRVVAVSNPVCWRCLNSRADVELMRKALAGRDYLMYRIILAELDDFQSGRKGIFLTNTRHAYKGIKNRSGRYYWNTGTFFHQWHPGKTTSIRFHNVSLRIDRRREVDPQTSETAQGLERVDYGWVRPGDGLWDSAFRAHGDRPVALSLEATPFGSEPYIGNHMLDAAAGQTLADAYDAVIFLAPLDKLRSSATFDALYTAEFRAEVERRYRLLFTEEELRQRLESEGVGSLRELVVREAAAQPERLLSEEVSLGPIDAWRKK